MSNNSFLTTKIKNKKQKKREKNQQNVFVIAFILNVLHSTFVLLVVCYFFSSVPLSPPFDDCMSCRSLNAIQIQMLNTYD